MADQEKPDIAQHSITVAASRERAFRSFVEELQSWWPTEYTWSREVLDTIRIEAKEGGRCFEVGPHGFQCDWGRVIEYDPPKRIRFLWQISPTRAPEPNPEKASEVEVRFEADGESTTYVMLKHRDFANHGDGADDYRAAMGSPHGWPYILERYHSIFG